MGYMGLQGAVNYSKLMFCWTLVEGNLSKFGFAPSDLVPKFPAFSILFALKPQWGATLQIFVYCLIDSIYEGELLPCDSFFHPAGSKPGGGLGAKGWRGCRERLQVTAGFPDGQCTPASSITHYPPHWIMIPPPLLLNPPTHSPLTPLHFKPSPVKK